MGEVEPLPGPRDADVGEAALLLELVGLAERAQVGEHAVLHADEEHRRELEALGRVQGHEHDRRLVAVERVGVGHQAHLLEELVDVGRTRGRRRRARPGSRGRPSASTVCSASSSAT